LQMSIPHRTKENVLTAELVLEMQSHVLSVVHLLVEPAVEVVMQLRQVGAEAEQAVTALTVDNSILREPNSAMAVAAKSDSLKSTIDWFL